MPDHPEQWNDRTQKPPGTGPWIGVLLAGGLAQTVGPRVMQGGFGLLVAALGILPLTVLRRALADVGGPYTGEPYP